MNGKRLTPTQLDELRKEAVSLRLQKKSLNEIQRQTGLSHPTIISSYNSFLTGGWNAIKLKKRGRPKGTPSQQLNEQVCIKFLLGNSPDSVKKNQFLWTNASVQEWLSQSLKIELSAKSVDRYLEKWGFLPANTLTKLTSPKAWFESRFPDSARKAHTNKQRIFIGGIAALNPKLECEVDAQVNGCVIYARDLRGKSYWLASPNNVSTTLVLDFMQRLLKQFGNNIVLVFKSYPLERYQDIQCWLKAQPRFSLLPLNTTDTTTSAPLTASRKPRNPLPSKATYELSDVRHTMALTHLQRLESESMQIMREVVTETENPVMLYSIGKDSAVMLHLAMKAFYPCKPPFPLLHVDTGWKFRDMYIFRDQLVKDLSMELITYMNPEGVEKNINPFTHGSALHTNIMKTEALKQALDKFGFDAAFGGARRDEEKSRAKERIFSFRSSDHHWDPKSQRPELWKHYNAKKHHNESIRVFPISNWTELDIWQYIYLESIPIVPLYLAAERPVVERDGMLIMVDDERIPMKSGEVPMMKKVRFRTLGCYPLTGAIESEADTLPSVIQEMLLTKTSERQGRLIDHDSTASMEKKKQEGYF